MSIAEAIENNLRQLDRCLLFQALDQPARLDLARRAHRIELPAGTPVYQVGDPGENMMVVLAGTLRIWLPTLPGKEIILADIGPGEVVGEIALLDGEARSAAVTALTKCQLLVLERRDVLPFLRDNPEAALSLIALLCRRVRRADQRMTDIALSHLPARLARTLIGRVPTDARPPARLALSQSELADMVSATRESVNRALRAWHRRGIVELRDGWIVLLRQDALAALAGSA
jgi:CRP-like cAMP-binding protein